MPKVKGKIKKKKKKGKVQATECNSQYTPSNHCLIRQATPLARMTTVPWESLHSVSESFIIRMYLLSNMVEYFVSV